MAYHISDGPMVTTPRQIRTLAYELRHAQITLRTEDMYAEIDTQTCIVSICKRMSNELREKWTSLTTTNRRKHGNYLPVSKCVDFVEDEAGRLNDPLFGREAFDYEPLRHQRPKSIADFSMIDSFSLYKLHSNYCMSLYGCELWNYNSRYINDIYVAWRKVIRKLFKLPYRTHNYLVCGIVECITVKLDRRLTKFVHSMINSKNSTVRELIANFLTTESSVFAENCRYLMYKYDISVFACYGSLYDVMNCIKNIQNVSNEHASNIASIKELCKIRDKVVYSELSPLEANTLIELICTN